MTDDTILRLAEYVLGGTLSIVVGAVTLAWKGGTRNAELVARAACDQRHNDCTANCASHDQRIEATLVDLREETRAELGRRAEAKIVSDLRDETRAGLNRTADAKVVDRLELTVGDHSELIARMDARMDGLAEGMVRIETGIDHISKRLDDREG